MTPLRITIALLATCVYSQIAVADADLVPVYLDGAGTGFNSNATPHALSTSHGNPGTTLGEQRRWAFEQALNYWERRLDSNVPIRVETEMTNLDCDAFGAVLAAAGPNSVYGNWSAAAGGSAAPVANTWYGEALANRIRNADLDGGSNDIGSEFNAQIDAGCLPGFVWYYGLGDAPAGTISFHRTALHEIAHGLNVLTLVNLTTGSRFVGADDIYMTFLHDHSTGKNWKNMSNAERAISAVDSNDLHWVGGQVTASLGQISSGKSGGHAQMYAPLPLEGGSSVSHWDTDVDDASGNSELMEPAATGSEKMLLTDEMLHDMGWNDVTANNCSFASDRVTVSTTNNGTVNNNACVALTYDGATINTGTTTATAGQYIQLQDGFNVQTGATFSANTDPDIGL